MTQLWQGLSLPGDEMWNNFHQEHVVAFTHTGPYICWEWPPDLECLRHYNCHWLWLHRQHVVAALLQEGPGKFYLSLSPQPLGSVDSYSLAAFTRRPCDTRTQCRLWPFPDVTLFSLWRHSLVAPPAFVTKRALLLLRLSWSCHLWLAASS